MIDHFPDLLIGSKDATDVARKDQLHRDRILGIVRPKYDPAKAIPSLPEGLGDEPLCVQDACRVSWEGHGIMLRAGTELRASRYGGANVINRWIRDSGLRVEYVRPAPAVPDVAPDPMPAAMIAFQVNPDALEPEAIEKAIEAEAPKTRGKPGPKPKSRG